jgi:hypothetical protein
MGKTKKNKDSTIYEYCRYLADSNYENSTINIRLRPDSPGYAYRISMSDCNRSIHLHGDINTKSEVTVAVNKIENIIVGLRGLQKEIRKLKKTIK